VGRDRFLSRFVEALCGASSVLLRRGVIIILAGGQNEDGSASSESLIRCRAAAVLYASGDFRRVVVTGGASNGNKNGRSLASAMAEVLVKCGVDRSRIVVEEASTSTRKSAIACAWILASDPGPVSLVTSAIHCPRSAWTFQKFFPRIQTIAAQRIVSGPTITNKQFALELLKISYYFVRGWLWFPFGGTVSSFSALESPRSVQA
jgi:uncharacterized SAM-binding protein YcdF (DUF218 family)